MVLPALVIYVIFHTLEKAVNLAYMQKLNHIQRSQRSDQSLASQGEGFDRTDFTDAQWGVVVKA